MQSPKNHENYPECIARAMLCVNYNEHHLIMILPQSTYRPHSYDKLFICYYINNRYIEWIFWFIHRRCAYWRADFFIYHVLSNSKNTIICTTLCWNSAMGIPMNSRDPANSRATRKVFRIYLKKQCLKGLMLPC